MSAEGHTVFPVPRGPLTSVASAPPVPYLNSQFTHKTTISDHLGEQMLFFSADTPKFPGVTTGDAPAAGFNIGLLTEFKPEAAAFFRDTGT